MPKGVPNLGRLLTPTEIERIRELRHLDGLTCQQVAEITGRHALTIRRLAPGRPGKVPVAPLREAFLRSPVTATDVARELGWWAGRAGRSPDSSRVKRTLGLLPDISGRGGRSWRTLVDAETIERIADTIGVSPWSVMPDDDSEAA